MGALVMAVPGRFVVMDVRPATTRVEHGGDDSAEDIAAAAQLHFVARRVDGQIGRGAALDLPFVRVRPAQWSKLIFNSSVNAVAALAELPHSFHFAEEGQFSDLGHLLHALIEEGKRVAEAAGVKLYEDPWEMNKV